ncbi:MAG: DMT family transporter [Rhodospirillaceae bacterium]|nr:DMT family transporter [Rhodospirillaceae bacterium]
MSAPRPTAPAERKLFGIGLMLLSIGLYAVQDAIAKHLAPDYTATQILFFRALGATLVLLPLIVRAPAALWVTRQPWIMLVRCVAGAGGMACYIIAFRTMPLAEVSAIGFSGVLMVSVLAGWVLRERMEWRRWAAVVVGFAGVLIAMRPGLGVFGIGALWTLGGAVAFAVMTLTLRVLGRTDHPVTVTAYFAVFSIVVLGALVPPVWRSPDAAGYGWLMLQGVMCGGGQLLMATSYRYAPASAVSPFTYTIIVYGLIIGYFWFGDVPDPVMLAGVSVLIGSCLYLARREHLTERDAVTKVS